MSEVPLYSHVAPVLRVYFDHTRMRGYALALPPLAEREREREREVQGYLAHNTPHPPPRTTVGS